jgi:hypothetical protein
MEFSLVFFYNLSHFSCSFHLYSTLMYMQDTCSVKKAVFRIHYSVLSFVCHVSGFSTELTIMFLLVHRRHQNIAMVDTSKYLPIKTAPYTGIAECLCISRLDLKISQD